MKLRADIVRTYRDIHSWVGILCGLMLFAAFYAGSITMFAEPLGRWASLAPEPFAPTTLSGMPDLLRQGFERYPAARGAFTVQLRSGDAEPAGILVMMPDGHARGRGGAGGAAPVAATLDPAGKLVTRPQGSSALPFVIDRLHRQVGLWLPEGAGDLVMGSVALLYGLALVSGVLVILPGLVRNLFAIRIDAHPKRRWLDLHGMLGLLSLPFHLVMALTSVSFAFHEQLFDAERWLLHGPVASAGSPDRAHRPHALRPGASASVQPVAAVLAPPAEIVAALARQAPGFIPRELEYAVAPDGRMRLRVGGQDPRYGLRGAERGFATVDPATGRVLDASYLPGWQPASFAVITAFFTLHFGSFGGLPIRFSYALLGLGGAFMFFGGNRLWIAARRRRRAVGGAPVDTRGTRLLSVLTNGCCGGCMAGIAAMLAGAPLLPGGGTPGSLSAIYWTVFLSALLIAALLPERRSLVVLLRVTGLLTLCMPAVWLVAHRAAVSAPMEPSVLAVNLGAVLFGVLLLLPVPTPRERPAGRRNAPGPAGASESV